MESKKRIAIFCPTFNETEQIKWFLQDYFKQNFPKNLSQIEFQAFESIYQPREGFVIGARGQDELLYVIDKHSPAKTKEDYDTFLAMSYKMSLDLINKNKIPYLFYQGEFGEIWNQIKVSPVKREELRRQFLKKLEGKLDGISIHDKLAERLKPLFP